MPDVVMKARINPAMNMGLARTAYIALLPALLSGCVAALIPVAAGGMMAGKEKIGIGDQTKADISRPIAIEAQMTAAVAAPAATPALDPIVVFEDSPPALAAELRDTENSRPPSARVSASPMSSYQAFSGIFGYAAAQAAIDPVSEPRQSALLAAPGVLTPDRSDCSIRSPAVIFDLDPDGGVFDTSIDEKGDPALIQMLRAFRMQDIEIFWVSALPALDAGAVRRRLLQSGLDPVGRDGLLLMRRAGDRKQTRRRDLLETHCVIAVAGDTKSDFDELYDYLKDPSAAEPLDALVDAGWFLTPLPLLNQSTTEGQ